MISINYKKKNMNSKKGGDIVSVTLQFIIFEQLNYVNSVNE